MRSKKTAVMALATCLSLALSWSILASAEDMPQDPSWLTNDSAGNYGLVDTSRMPRTLGVVNCNGDVVGYALTAELFAMPSLSPEELQAIDMIAPGGFEATGATTGTVVVYDAEDDKPIGYIGNECFAGVNP